MRISNRLWAIPVLTASIMQLSGCGEGSNNLANPVSDNSTTITSCKTESICVSGQFVDEPVVGLNYSCNLIEGVTDADGVFTCPNNSVVTFYLKAKNGKYKIELGQYKLKALGNVNNPIKHLIQITPRDLTTVSGLYPEQDLESSGAIVVDNILRLLQALDSDEYYPNNPALNRIVIKDSDKQQLDVIGQNIDSGDFTKTANFEKMVQPLFIRLNKPTALSDISAQKARDRFKIGLKQLDVGIYDVSATIFPIAESANTVTYSGMLAKGNNNDYSLVGMSFLIDRDGKTIGSGLEWQAVLDAQQVNQGLLYDNIVVKNQNRPKSLAFSSENGVFDISGKVKNFTLNVVSSATTQTNGQVLFDTLNITEGMLNKGQIVPSLAFYRNIYGTTSSPEDGVLGVWNRKSVNGIVQRTGTYRLEKIRSVTSLLEPSIWRTKDNINVSEKPIFPLHLRLTVRDSSEDTSCSLTKEGCLLGVMGVSILENGNIITDMDNDCSAVDSNLNDAAFDPTKTVDSSNFVDNKTVQEHRLGFISTVLRDEETLAIREAISPIIAVGAWAENTTDEVWKRFYGLQLGIDTKVEINVANAVNGVVTIQHQKGDLQYGAKPLWTNYIKSLRFLTTIEKDNIKTSDTEGRITNIQTQACYNPQPKT